MNKKLVNILNAALAAVLVITTIIEIFHLPSAGTAALISRFAFISFFGLLIYENTMLKKKIKEFEKN